MRRLFVALAMGVSALAVVEAQAQSSKSEVQSSKLLITVSDPSGGVIPGATVMIA